MDTPDYLDPYARKKLEEYDATARFRHDTINRLRKEASVQHLLAPYSEKDREEFLAHYADRLLYFQEQGRLNAGKVKRVARQFEEEAQRLLWYIQHQKLYALKLRWRAKQIELPGITLCDDIDDWERNIAYCPLIGPVTEEEIRLLQAYLAHPDCPEGSFYSHDYLYGWYEQSEEDIEMPLWYSLCFRETGTGYLLELPDLRGPEEEFYLGLFREQEALKRAARGEPEPEPYVEDTRPYHWDHKSEIESEIIRRFDKDPRLPEFKRAFDAAQEFDPMLADEIIMAPDVLFNVPGPLAVEAADDWKTGIAELAKATRRKYTSIALEEVYLKYKQVLAEGTLADWEKPEKRYEGEEEFRQQKIQQLEEGKRLAREKGLTPPA